MIRTLDPKTIEKIRTILFVHENQVELKIEHGMIVVVEVKRKVVSKENPNHE